MQLGETQTLIPLGSVAASQLSLPAALSSNLVVLVLSVQACSGKGSKLPKGT